MTANGQTCGNCGGTVSNTDVLCPHCGALLAAYASPTGSATTAPTYSPEPVDISIPEPAEIDIPASVPAPGAEVDHVSTAPRPLFDLDVTAEELAEAADSDHDEDVVTITDPDAVANAAPAVAVPDYARPPADAPTPVMPTLDAPLPATPTINEPPIARPTPAKQKSIVQEPKDAGNPSVGQTDDYLRKLHKQSGYKPSNRKVSQPVETTRPAPADRGTNRDTREQRNTQRRASRAQRRFNKTSAYIVSLLVFLVCALWGTVVLQIVFGSFNGAVVFIAVIATIALSKWRDLVQMFSND